MTEDEFMRLPDDGRKYELVDGEAKVVPASYTHNIIEATVISMIRPYAKGHGYVAGSQAGFRMISGNIRCPDCSFMLKSRLPDGKPSQGFQEGAPDLCIEILSPSEEQADVQRKLFEYFDYGAKLVWHMIPETEQIRVYTGPTAFQTLGPADEIEAGDLLPGFRCRVAELFALE
jgi:Uma2 family endonuclease